jgi:hypothetical protein
VEAALAGDLNLPATPQRALLPQDRNKGNRRHNNIYDNTASRALKTMAAGMMSGATSPARPWFRLADS